MSFQVVIVRIYERIIIEDFPYKRIVISGKNNKLEIAYIFTRSRQLTKNNARQNLFFFFSKKERKKNHLGGHN